MREFKQWLSDLKTEFKESLVSSPDLLWDENFYPRFLPYKARKIAKLLSIQSGAFGITPKDIWEAAKDAEWRISKSGKFIGATLIVNEENMRTTIDTYKCEVVCNTHNSGLYNWYYNDAEMDDPDLPDDIFGLEEWLLRNAFPVRTRKAKSLKEFLARKYS